MGLTAKAVRHFCMILFLFTVFYASAEQIPRKVIVFYDSHLYPETSHTKFHQLAEMPLNHLGLICDYHDIWKPLPNIKDDRDVIGVATWFTDNTQLSEAVAERYLNWAVDAVSSGKKYVILGNPAFESDQTPISQNRLNEFWNQLGLYDTEYWETEGYAVELVPVVPKMINFERKYPKIPFGFKQMVPQSENVNCYLAAKKKGDPDFQACLIATCPSGGYAANEYASYYRWEEGKEGREWYINPFLFFYDAFGLSRFPIPDTTTLDGRRIYYSHIDGDGWNNVTEITEFKEPNNLSSHVILEKVVKKYPDLPVTVGPITADIDLDWVGTPLSQEVAVEFFNSPNVEVGCHTFTHPFAWGFFEDYLPMDEYPYLPLYPSGSWLGRGIVAKMNIVLGRTGVINEEEQKGTRRVKSFDEAYKVPRAFALKPFNLDYEVFQAIDYTNTIVPKGKPVALYQWSGDCEPFLAALVAVEESGVMDINGGDSRFDKKFPSYTWVAPLTRQLAEKRQVYASNSNENTYTNYWRSDFYAFSQLPETFKNTESPIRIKPMNLYYHMYSGEKKAGLIALERNLRYITTQKMIPIEASAFSRIVRGFFSINIDQKNENEWVISNRGALQTVRFDRSSDWEVDFKRSKGVIGQNYYAGSLYVFLDDAATQAAVALKKHDYQPAPARVFCLTESRWRVYNVKQEAQKVSFTSKGYGMGEMRWNTPIEGTFEITVNGEVRAIAKSRGATLDFALDYPAIKPVEVVISWVK